MTSRDVIQLRILGIPGLDGPGRDCATVLSQPKRLVLLVFLAMRGGWVRRDALVEMFWPDHDPAAGRRALSQALHFLRRSLGGEVIRTRGVEEVRLSGEAVDCDVDRFSEAVGQRHWQDALDVYRGELLRGVTAEPSPAFSHWLESERARLQRLAGEAAAKQATMCFEAGDVPAAVKFQSRAHEIRPTDEATLREYLMLLDEIGDAAEALRAYEAFRVRLAAGYGLEPSKETVRIVEMIRARRPEAEPGLRARSAVVSERTAEGVPAGGGPGAASTRDGVAAGTTGEGSWGRFKPRLQMRYNWSRRLVFAITIFIAFLAVIEPLATRRGSATGVEPEPVVYPPNRVAIMYFDVGGDTTELARIADLLTEVVIQRLTEIDTLHVISSDGVFRFRRKHPPTDTIINALHVGTVVNGRIHKLDGTTSIMVDISDMTGTTTVAINRIDFKDTDVLAMVDSVAEIISDDLRRKIGDDIELGRWRGAANAEAEVAYANALSVEREFDAISKLGTASVQESISAADELLEKALRLDPGWVEPHLLRGQLAWSMGFHCMITNDCDRSSAAWLGLAGIAAARALEIDGGNSRALELRGRTRFYAWVYGFENDPKVIDEAEGDLREALRQNRRNAMAWKTLSAVLNEKNDLVGALEAAKGALDVDQFLKERSEVLWRLFETAFELENDLEATTACRRLRDSGNNAWQAAMCELELDAWAPDRRIDIDSARRLAEPHLHATDRVGRRNAPIIGMLYAAVLARNNEKSAAKKIIRAMHLIAEQNIAAGITNAEVTVYEAAAWARLGEVDTAIELATSYLEKDPSVRKNIASRRWFKGEVARRLTQPILDSAPQPLAGR